MTAKRFTIIDGVKKGTYTGIWDNQKLNNQRMGDELWLGEVVGMLNEGVTIAEENEHLRKENKRLNELVEYFADELKIDLGELEEWLKNDLDGIVLIKIIEIFALLY